MSKGLEALNRISTGSIRGLDLDIITKELKAFEIIKNKKVDVSYLCIIIEADIIYNTNIAFSGYNLSVENKYKLTQKEFDLLKEILEIEQV